MYIKKCFSILLTAVIFSMRTITQQNTSNAESEINTSYSAEDICTLQNILITRNADTSYNIKLDVNSDNVLASFDLCLMKKQYLNSVSVTIIVSTSDELINALNFAESGNIILLNPGTYETSQSGKSDSLFYSASSGTEQLPISLKSAAPDNPAVLSGSNSSENIVLYIIGEFWNIENIVCCNAKKGIMLDQASHTVIKNTEVYNTGQEGIHLRDGSSECQILDCYIHDTGLLSPQYGEGIYIGSASSTSGYNYNCDNNIINGCILGPNITAEHVDIKEYTTGNIIENCVMYGNGMTETDSFVDIKGNESVVRYNICDTQGNENITDAFQVHSQVDGWGINNFVYGNSITFSGETEYIVRTWSGTSCTVYDNNRFPENSSMMYRAYNGSTITIQNDSN